jgi:ketosteroid isomerase-like protein
MQLPSSIAAVILLVGLCASSQTSNDSKPPTQLTTAEQQVTSFERAIELAAAHGDLKILDAAADDSIRYTHGDDWTMGGSPHAVNDKEAWLGWLGNPKTRMLSREVSEQHVELHGDVALTTGKIDTRTDSSDPKLRDYTIWYLRVYRRQDGRWRLLSHHTVREIFKTTDK